MSAHTARQKKVAEKIAESFDPSMHHEFSLNSRSSISDNQNHSMESSTSSRSRDPETKEFAFEKHEVPSREKAQDSSGNSLPTSSLSHQIRKRTIDMNSMGRPSGLAGSSYLDRSSGLDNSSSRHDLQLSNNHIYNRNTNNHNSPHARSNDYLSNPYDLGKGYRYTIYLPTEGDIPLQYGQMIQLEVGPATTALQLLSRGLQLHQDEYPESRFGLDASIYQLLVFDEDDMEVDDDFPALGDSTKIKNAGSSAFMLRRKNEEENERRMTSFSTASQQEEFHSTNKPSKFCCSIC